MARPMGSRSRRARDRLNETVGGPTIGAAAVCFRRRDRRLQFRLVRTSDGERWTFPNGPPTPEETLYEAALREAAEKAGVTGVIVETPLTEYRYGRRVEDVAAAFLVAVQSVAPFAGSGGAPAWFDLPTTRQKLTEGRDAEHAQEVQRVLDIAAEELRDR